MFDGHGTSINQHHTVPPALVHPFRLNLCEFDFRRTKSKAEAAEVEECDGLKKESRGNLCASSSVVVIFRDLVHTSEIFCDLAD